MIVGIIVGARLGHCLFYEPAYYLANPIEILKIWEGGLASHGGVIGIIIVRMALFTKCLTPQHALDIRPGDGSHRFYCSPLIRLGNLIESRNIRWSY